MFNFVASVLLALAITAALGTQLVATAYRNTLLPACAGCELHSHVG
ncbi:MAG TPA: hypothetical protein VGP41_14030 [Candidatus Lustribacter sp.]|jgi:hypothetical protein|nr:hypothetical protein [Candidatus Lustribacter sp.]